MGKFQRSWLLLKRSMQVVWENKKLLLFPVIITGLVVLMVLFFIVPIALWNTGYAYNNPAHWKTLTSFFIKVSDTGHFRHVTPLAYTIAAVIYLVAMFLSTFLNVAFFNEILNALNGRQVSVLGGLRFACSRLKPILMWSLFSGAVGLLIKAIEERVGLIGRWVAQLLGTAWSIASVFVIPLIVREEKHANPLRLLKTSAGLLRNTWGEALIGYVGLRSGSLFILIASLVIPGGGIVMAIVLNSVVPVLIGFMIWITLVVIAEYLISAASMVYQGALYIYASEGVVPGPFVPEEMDMAWNVKSARKQP